MPNDKQTPPTGRTTPPGRPPVAAPSTAPRQAPPGTAHASASAAASGRLPNGTPPAQPPASGPDTPADADQTHTMLERLTLAVEEMTGLWARAVPLLETLVAASAAKVVSPDYRFRMNQWPNVEAICARRGITVIERDGDGPTTLEWGGFHYYRRSGKGKYGLAVWFSRPSGKDEEGEATWERLLSFKEYDPTSGVPTEVKAATK